MPGYVIGSISCDVVDEQDEGVILEPRFLLPLHAEEAIDLRARMTGLSSAAPTNAVVQSFLNRLGTHINSSQLASLGSEVHQVYPLGAETIQRLEETDDIIADFAAKEGKWVIRTHRQKERSRKVVDVAKKKFRAKHGKLFCECCGIEFGVSYAPLGTDFIEAHHKTPLETLLAEQETRPEDLAMVCPNCHRMIHRTKKCSLDEVKRLLKRNGSFINAANLKLLAP